ncbi:hypothetical protein HZA40_00740 [Candidatus Peregrinibacteria bacterium]|nr:hypothetical protein [Candidatus Peregrinibacteria bacterium]
MKKALPILLTAMILVGCSSPTVMNGDKKVPLESYNGANFSFKYPGDLTLTSNTNMVAGFGASLSGVEGYQPATNLSSASIQIASDDSAAMCEDVNIQAFGGKQGNPSTVSIAGTDFKKQFYQDAGAGQREDSIVYTAVNNKKCYKMALVMQYSVVENSDGKLKKFDQLKLEKVFQVVADSFIFN